MEEHIIDCEEDFDYDKRTLMRKLSDGVISEENVKKYFAELPDLSFCAEEMIIE